MQDPQLFPAPRIYETYATLKKGGAPFPKPEEINSPPYQPPSRRKQGRKSEKCVLSTNKIE